MKYYTIYKTTNLINNKIYIGKHETINPYDDYLGSGVDLTKDIKKFGKQNFKKEVLFIFDNEDEMTNKEIELVTEDFIKLDGNYNKCPGGKGGWGYVNSKNLGVLIYNQNTNFLENSKKGLKSIAYLRENDQEWNERVSLAISQSLKKLYGNGHPGSFTGKSHTNESKLAQSLKASERIGDKNSQFGTMWITNGIESIKVKKDFTIPEGWCKGRKIKKRI